MYQSSKEFLETTPLKAVLGYAPDVEVEKTREAQIYRQTVDDLDITAVIAAVNGTQGDGVSS